MARPSITLYYDLVSPFAYIAYYLLRHSPTFKDIDITYIPVFLGGIMQATGNRPPLAVPEKAAWINRERIRWAAAFDIPIAESAPDGFPVLTVTPMRALTALAQHHPAHHLRAADALYAAFWGPPRNARQVTQAAGLTAVLEEAVGAEVAADAMARAGGEAKGALAARTAEAVGVGAFGLPWMVVEDGRGGREAFWGVDHLGMVCEFLGLERVGEKGWRSVL